MFIPFESVDIEVNYAVPSDLFQKISTAYSNPARNETFEQHAVEPSENLSNVSK